MCCTSLCCYLCMPCPADCVQQNIHIQTYLDCSKTLTDWRFKIHQQKIQGKIDRSLLWSIHCKEKQLGPEKTKHPRCLAKMKGTKWEGNKKKIRCRFSFRLVLAGFAIIKKLQYKLPFSQWWKCHLILIMSFNLTGFVVFVFMVCARSKWLQNISRNYID